MCLLRGGFTGVEQTLLEGAHGEDVIRQRMAFQRVMRARFEQVVVQATGRKVVGFMSGNQRFRHDLRGLRPAPNHVAS